MTYTIKLMADYQSWPLWWAGEGKVGNINPQTLPLSSSTLTRLDKWAEAYDAQMNLEDPAQSEFFTKTELDAFNQDGLDIWQQLRQELSPNYEVWYFSPLLRQILKHPEDISGTEAD